MKNEKTYLDFHIPKVWQSFKYFAETFGQATTLKMEGVISTYDVEYLMGITKKLE